MNSYSPWGLASTTSTNVKPFGCPNHKSLLTLPLWLTNHEEFLLTIGFSTNQEFFRFQTPLSIPLRPIYAGCSNCAQIRVLPFHYITYAMRNLMGPTCAESTSWFHSNCSGRPTHSYSAIAWTSPVCNRICTNNKCHEPLTRFARGDE